MWILLKYNLIFNKLVIKNGGIVDTIPVNDDIIRGKRSKIPLLYYDYEFDKENLDKVVKEYIIK